MVNSSEICRQKVEYITQSLMLLLVACQKKKGKKKSKEKQKTAD